MSNSNLSYLSISFQCSCYVLKKTVIALIVPKAKEAPVSPKAEAKAKAFETKKAVLKSLHSHSKNRSTHYPPSDSPRDCSSEGSPNILRRAPPAETSFTTMPSPSSF